MSSISTDEIDENVMQFKGIDVSHWQGNIAWGDVATDDVVFAMIKMSEGATNTDPNFGDNWKGARDAGLLTGAYHVFRSLSSTPEEQADNIKNNLAKVGFDPATNWLAIDVEAGLVQSATPEIVADNLYALLRLIHTKVLPGHMPAVYCSPSVWDKLVMWEKYDFSEFPLWVAHWDVIEPRVPRSWADKGKSWSMWQYSSAGTVKGIQGRVDLDLLNAGRVKG